ncbi:MAG: hypothetical protein V9F04_06715 [Dermatophilaceae bacterium]
MTMNAPETTPAGRARNAARLKAVAAVVAAFLGLVLVARCGSGIEDLNPDLASEATTSATATSEPSPSPTVETTPTTPTPSTPVATATPTSEPGAETPEQALAIVTQIVAAQAAAAVVPDAAGDAARAQVYAGPALIAANAAAKLRTTLSADALADLSLKLDAAPVLAISRGAAYPRSIVVRALKAKTGAPVYLLLHAVDASGYRIHNQATMLPGTFSGQFDALAAGSPVVTDGSGLAIAPDALMAAYAAWLAFPRAAAAPPATLANDAFADSLLKGAQSESAALKDVAKLTQAHTPIGTQVAIRLGEGKGALATMVIERTDTYTETTANALTPPKEYTILTGKTVIDKKATLKSLQFIVFFVPPSGPAQAIAVSDQLVSASGS